MKPPPPSPVPLPIAEASECPHRCVAMATGDDGAPEGEVTEEAGILRLRVITPDGKEILLDGLAVSHRGEGARDNNRGAEVCIELATASI